jgi:hypothetical protein
MKTSLLLFLFLLSQFCFAQNLVPNPSFEDTTMCPDAGGQVSRAQYWQTVANTPDYFNACSIHPQISVPSNTFGYQDASSGEAYMGLCDYTRTNMPSDSLYREVIGTNLITALSIGQKYFVTFKACLSFNPLFYNWAANNKLGMLFSTVNYLSVSYNQTNYCQVHEDSIIRDSINWTIVRGSFIADSAYTYISIGNFFVNSLIDTIHLMTSSNNAYAAYYYIDDVCVSTDSLTCNGNVGITENILSDGIALFPNPTSGILTVSFQNFRDAEVSIYDGLGRKVFSSTARNQNSLTLNLGAFAPGCYVLQLVSEKDGKAVVRKVIKL